MSTTLSIYYKGVVGYQVLLWSSSLFTHSTNVVMNYSEVETKVREATNDETWGPHGSLMSEIAKYTFTYEHFPEAMAMLWRRMFESKKNWRRTYKVWKNTHTHCCALVKESVTTYPQVHNTTVCYMSKYGVYINDLIPIIIAIST